MTRPWIPEPIGPASDATVIRGRENVPKGDLFCWWTMHYEYVEKVTGEAYRMPDLQRRYGIGFMDPRMDEILKTDYEPEGVQVYTMNICHPRYDELVGSSRDIVFEED